MQIQANFTAIAKSIFYDYYWLFLCLTSLALFLLLWLRLSFTISFRNKKKPVYKIAWQSKRFKQYISRVNFYFILGVLKHGLSKNTLIFPTFGTAQNLHFLYTSNCIVFDLDYFCNSCEVCSFLQDGLQRFSKKCPALNIILCLNRAKTVPKLCLKCALTVPKVCLICAFACFFPVPWQKNCAFS